MSKFIPYASVYREWTQQQKRLDHGLKTGTHVRYPDPNTGPFILRKEVAERQAELDKDLNPEQKVSLLGRLIGRKPPEVPRKTHLATGRGTPLNRKVRRQIGLMQAKEEK